MCRYADPNGIENKNTVKYPYLLVSVTVKASLYIPKWYLKKDDTGPTLVYSTESWQIQ